MRQLYLSCQSPFMLKPGSPALTANNFKTTYYLFSLIFIPSSLQSRRFAAWGGFRESDDYNESDHLQQTIMYKVPRPI